MLFVRVLVKYARKIIYFRFTPVLCPMELQIFALVDENFSFYVNHIRHFLDSYNTFQSKTLVILEMCPAMKYGIE